ncbi:hypothetical protein COO60DRAFT_1480764 [Scenedesmus sp. NREL 46B-D3]|nr:hypothetical protein COO60DRAFT_1480750 [Scenedesmus sp. NREL 46B-D3]KAF6265141.1 hypothetical protein COO60DRAFT_1480764 [Scenedesmus sp. NREL 46B-D3]
MLLGLKFNSTLQTFYWHDGSPFDWWPSSVNITQAPDGKPCIAVSVDAYWQPVSCTSLPGVFACQMELNSTASSASHSRRPELSSSLNSTSSAGCPSACSGGGRYVDDHVFGAAEMVLGYQPAGRTSARPDLQSITRFSSKSDNPKERGAAPKPPSVVPNRWAQAHKLGPDTAKTLNARALA